MINQRSSSGSLSRLLLIAGVSACSADVVDLGGGDMRPVVERGARCADSVIVPESVRMTNQVELEALRGCEAIQGDLIVETFAGADTSPLASLRTIDGHLMLGAYPTLPPGSIYDYPAKPATDVLVEDVIERGYLASLHGLEALEQVGSIALNGVGIPDLSAFESLRSLFNPLDAVGAGLIEIDNAPNLTSLAGFENVSNVTQLVLVNNPALQSLRGLVLTANIGAVSINGSPQLSSLLELAPVISLAALGLANVGIRNLDDLENLYQVVALDLANNPELENVNRLSAFANIESLSITRNPKLTAVPPLANLAAGLSTVLIEANPELRSIALGLTQTVTAYITRGRPTYSSAGFFEIRNNPRLETLALAAGLEKADYLNVDNNGSLTSIDFGSLRSLDRLALQDNTALATLVLGGLQTVDSLWVTDNPLLVTAQLGTVLSFERVMSGNADDGAVGENTSP